MDKNEAFYYLETIYSDQEITQKKFAIMGVITLTFRN
jgi:hypothetical protein